jgi:membrane protein implicated in regulation of membrane protease activity
VNLESPAIAWLVFAIVAAIVEVSIPHFGLVFVAGAAVVAAAAAFLGLGGVGQAVLFIVTLGVSLVFLRPRFVKRLGARGVPSRTDALLGRNAVVTHDIDSTTGVGRVNVGGQDWAARSEGAIPAGTKVRVVGADGIVLEVSRP